MDKEAKTYHLLSTRDSPRAKDTHRLNVRGWEKIFHPCGQDRKAGVAVLILHKILFKIKAIKTDKEGHYLMVKGSIQEEDFTESSL